MALQLPDYDMKRKEAEDFFAFQMGTPERTHYLGVGAYAGRSTSYLKGEDGEMVCIMEDETGTWLNIHPGTGDRKNR